MKKAVFLYNVQSGKGHIARNVEKICGIFAEGGYAVTPRLIDFGSNPFDGNEQIDLMVVAGGDGTLNFALNAMKSKGLDIPSSGSTAAGSMTSISSISFRSGSSRPLRSGLPTRASTASGNWPT